MLHGNLKHRVSSSLPKSTRVFIWFDSEKLLTDNSASFGDGMNIAWMEMFM